MGTGFFFTCCCGGASYEAWAVLAAGPTVCIDAAVQKAGEDSDSRNEFTIDDDYGGEYLCSMARGVYVYLMEADDVDSQTEVSVAKYHAETGVLQWNQTTSTTVDPLIGYNIQGVGMNQEFYVINETQVWLPSTKQLFESTGITTETASPNTSTDVFDGTSAAWVPIRLASHDFPQCAGWRILWEIDTVTHNSTFFLGGGVWRHYYDVDLDAVLQIGIGSYDITDGFMDSVTVADTATNALTKSLYVDTGSSTPPSPAPSDVTDFDGASNSLIGFTDDIPDLETYITHFDAIDSDYAVAYRYWKYGHDGSNATKHSAIVVNGTVVSSQSSGSWDVAFPPAEPIIGSCDSVGVIHTNTGEGTYADVMVSFKTYSSSVYTYYLRGYNSIATQLWSETLDESAYIKSVSGTWVFVYYPIDVSADLAPDGRDWSGQSLASIPRWLVKADNSEWEPCREEVTATSWNQYTDMTNGINKLDLVKSSGHPYGPPDDSYNTTPP